MTHLQLFQSIIETQFQKNQVGNAYELKELNEPTYPITKVKKKGKASLYSFDTDDNLFPFFDTGKPFINKACDYMIFVEKGNNLYAFLIELKSRNHKAAYKQLFASEKFVKYLDEMAKAFGKIINDQLNPHSTLEIRHVIVSLKSNSFGTNVRNGIKYKVHSQYNYQYIHWKAGMDLNIDLFCK